MKVFLAVAAAVTLVLTGAPEPAQAQATAFMCWVDKPSVRADRSLDLFIGTTAPRYTGKPFSFRVTTLELVGGGTVRRVRTFDKGAPRSYHTPVLPGGRVTMVEGWQSGRYCDLWKGNVRVA